VNLTNTNKCAELACVQYITVKPSKLDLNMRTMYEREASYDNVDSFNENLYSPNSVIYNLTNTNSEYAYDNIDKSEVKAIL